MNLVRSTSLNTSSLRGAASVLRPRGHVLNGVDPQARGLERRNRRVATGARPLHPNLHLLHPEAPCGVGRLLDGALSGERSALARPLEAHRPRGTAREHVAVYVRDGDERVVEGGLDMGNAPGPV